MKLELRIAHDTEKGSLELGGNALANRAHCYMLMGLCQEYLVRDSIGKVTREIVTSARRPIIGP